MRYTVRPLFARAFAVSHRVSRRAVQMAVDTIGSRDDGLLLGFIVVDVGGRLILPGVLGLLLDIGIVLVVRVGYIVDTVLLADLVVVFLLIPLLPVVLQLIRFSFFGRNIFLSITTMIALAAGCSL